MELNDDFKANKGHSKDYNPAKIVQSLSKDSLKAKKKALGLL